MARPIVSVIIPTFNYGRFLPEAIESLQRQSLENWECIIVDDASTDDTPAIADSLAASEPRVRAVRLESNRGPSAARNRGIASAEAAHIQFLDADDRLEARKLETHANFLAMHPAIDLVYGAYRFFVSDPEINFHSLKGKLSRPLMDPVSGQGATLLKRLSLHNIMPINAALIRRALLDAVGGFDEEVRGCEDWNLLIHAAIAGASFGYVSGEESAALIRSHEASASRDGERLLKGLIVAARNFEQRRVAPWHGPPPIAYQAALGIEAVTNGDRIRGSKQLLGAVLRAGWTLNSIRWAAYAVFGLFLPRSWFLPFAARMIPEELIEIGQRIGRLFHR